MHHASLSFWKCYDAIPKEIQGQADKNFDLLKNDHRHPSLHFKKIGKYWSVRASREYRALGVNVEDGVLWFWVGTHTKYNRMLYRQ
ncbi:MAG: hypothetical protein JRJ21_05745 [Deltaproteobacteria bacterium]|nr:hypothetical protein [Deltaproteobacteria bacterium]